MLKRKKGDIELDTLGYWLLGAVALVLIVAGIVFFKIKGVSAIEYIKSLFRFR